jgi:hypothetical protein
VLFTFAVTLVTVCPDALTFTWIHQGLTLGDTVNTKLLGGCVVPLPVVVVVVVVPPVRVAAEVAVTPCDLDNGVGLYRFS